MNSHLFADIIAYLSQGGTVMIPLILCSFAMWTLILERMLFFSRLERKDIALHALVRILDKDPASKCLLPAGAKGPRTNLVSHVLAHRSDDHQVNKRVVDQCCMAMIPGFERHLAAIAVFAAVAPLFGLLGTVTGMITTFDVITLFGTGNAKAMAGGISEALVTTQSGLVVSIPGFFMSALLFRRSHGAKNRLEEAAIILKRRL
ncbi:MotA/TolQ/ExbB proton channel family protein [uncultured Desulfobacter sp.]|uniref:MotA/TolQ/ExbB proton channel family protein n=1 Tax=uncultured Desulfobacter sp. TaxID=240139 RepID=UPI002AAB3DF1|nr:MotA/TolQ/ExbB proton channel family protein [uncultured Desulfobacter sp.]